MNTNSAAERDQSVARLRRKLEDALFFMASETNQMRQPPPLIERRGKVWRDAKAAYDMAVQIDPDTDLARAVGLMLTAWDVSEETADIDGRALRECAYTALKLALKMDRDGWTLTHHIEGEGE